MLNTDLVTLTLDVRNDSAMILLASILLIVTKSGHYV